MHDNHSRIHHPIDKSLFAAFVAATLCASCSSDGQRAACIHTCEFGETVCSGDGYAICETDSDGCRLWSSPHTCPIGTICREDRCQAIEPDPIDPPPTPDDFVCIPNAKRCNADKTAVETCVADGQNVHWNPAPCGKGWQCVDETTPAKALVYCEEIPNLRPEICNPQCIMPSAKCDDKSIVKCTLDENACPVWSSPEPCPDGQECRDNACQPVACDDLCTLEQMKCIDKSVVKCTQAKSGCFDWATPEPCPDGQECRDNACRSIETDVTPWSIVVLPDTQNYTRHEAFTTDTIYHRQMKWIVEKRGTDIIPNLKMVVHMGDITDENSDVQWSIAKDAHEILRKEGIPFTLVTGNHDYKIGKNGAREYTKFPIYFPIDDLKSIKGFGDLYRDTNNYYTFTAANRDYLVLNLEFYPRQDVLCWANDVLRRPENQNKKVIITTHSNINSEANYTAHAKLQDVPNGAAGAEIWHNLTARHSNIAMVLSGHIGGSARRTDKGNAQNSVAQILTNYQYELPCSESTNDACNAHCRHMPNSGNGWLRVLTFYPAENKVKARTYSVLSGNATTFSEQGVDAFYCSERYTADKSHHWYSSDPANDAHQFEMAFDFTPHAYQYDDEGYLGFVRRDISETAPGNVIQSQIAANDSGTTVTVWESSPVELNVNSSSIYARILSPGGCERRSMPQQHIDVAQQTLGDPDVVVDDDGNFVVAWVEYDQNHISQIRLRGFDANGNERFASLYADRDVSSDQSEPNLAIANDGSFAITWLEQSPNATTKSLEVRSFASNGSPLTPAIDIDTQSTNGTLSSPDIAIDKFHDIALSWKETQNSSQRLRYTIVDQTIEKTIVAPQTLAEGGQLSPASISCSPEGSLFMATWSTKTSSDSSDIFARTFNATRSISAPFAVSSVNTKNEYPHICMTSHDSGVFTWYDAKTQDIMMRRYKSGAMTKYDESRINQPSNTQRNGYKGTSFPTDIACTPTGNHAFITWLDDNDNDDISHAYGYGFAI